MDKLFFENNAYEMGYKCVCGIDEAGRGPLAGPVFAACVVLPRNFMIDGVDDSKKLTEKRRDLFYDEIISKAKAYFIATASVKEIESVNILKATFLAMKRAYEGVREKLEVDIALIDGNKTPDLPIKTMPIVKGDSLSESIACASILAKVSRDRYMVKIAEKYPEYHFEKHKGYGTKLHIQALKEYGPSEIHRLSFLKKIL